MRCMVFDIETVPDTALGEKIFGLEGVEPEDIAGMALFLASEHGARITGQTIGVDGAMLI